jgi:hypothetical protein
MSSGKNKRIAAALLGAVALSLIGAPDVQSYEHRSGIWKVLRAGHFSGPMNDEAHVRPIKGTLAANGTRYTFWEYNWVEKRRWGHGRTLLLVFEQGKASLSYLGCYEFWGDDFRGPVHPEIRGKTVFFPYHDIQVMGMKQSYAISFENGPPPEAVPGSVNTFHR